jgi:hypothetical protein
MYCPKCAAQNVEDAKFCRVCGADISLVPMALAGKLPEDMVVEGEDYAEKKPRRRKSKDQPTLEKGLENIGVGIAFLIISYFVSTMFWGRAWWFWLLIPMFACFGEGIGQLIRSRRLRSLENSYNSQVSVPPAPGLHQLPPRNTSEIVPQPLSITEGTTRHLETEAPTRPIAVPVEKRAKDA